VPKRSFNVAAVVALLVIVLIVAIIWGAQMIRSALVTAMVPPPGVMYPDAPPMPPVSSRSIEELLAQFERLLTKQAPEALASLQPGLSDAQIDELEKKHQFKLTLDLRAFYRWRNGSPRDATLVVFAEHRFVPLDEALADRDALRQQVSAGDAAQRKADAALFGYREKWIGVIMDAAGDGYYFDPARSEDHGSFFYCFAEDGSYVFFPAFRNFLASTIEGHERGIFKFGSGGAETVDFNGAVDLWKRYGAAHH
jgi:cell wall assembly regulator SMI1